MKKTSIVLATALIAGLVSQTPVVAKGFGGASPFGANPELKLTIAERDRIKRNYRKTGRSPFAGNVNQKIGDDAIKWQLRFEKRRLAKKRGRFGFRVNNR